MRTFTPNGKAKIHKKAVIATIATYSAVAFFVGLIILNPEEMIIGIMLSAMGLLIVVLMFVVIVKTYGAYERHLRDF